jgi:hypothetical protein
MSNIRKFRSRGSAVATPHPDGGTLYLYKLDSIREKQLTQLLERIETEHDEDGSVVLDGDGKPVPRVWKSADEKELARMDAIRTVAVQSLSGLVDADTGEPIDCTPEIINAFLAETSSRPVPKEIPRLEWDGTTNSLKVVTDANGKPLSYTDVGPANEQIASFVLTEARKLARSGAEADAKNSSSTQSGSSAPPAS